MSKIKETFGEKVIELAQTTPNNMELGEKVRRLYLGSNNMIPKEEPKQETLEEVAEKTYQKGLKDDLSLSFHDGVKFGAKWQAEKMYSEKEIIRFLDWMGTNGYRHYSNGWANMFNKAMESKQLFEQFKNK